MSSLELESRFVKRGYWVNLSNGPIMGQTITTDSRTGGVIVALLAVITSLGMAHLWHLLTFLFYQIRADGRPADGLFRHQQALLRTLPTPSFLIADSIKLWLAWRVVCKHALFRTLVHLSTALFFAMVSLAVSVFSSSVVSSLNLEVLVQSPHCGTLNYDANTWYNYHPVSVSAANLYGPVCYNTTSLPSQCNLLPRPNIPFTAELAPCPFETKICATPALSLDSGLLDLNDAFGFNLRDSDRVRYRRKTTCAVLSLDGYTTVINGTSEDAATLSRPLFPGEQFVYYLYGKFETGRENLMGQSLVNSNTSSVYGTMNTITRLVRKSYYLVIPELQRRDADVALRLTAKNSIKYQSPVNDPMFSAHRPVDIERQDGNRTYYMSDFPGSVMGCAQQYQYCVNENSCSELSGMLGENVREAFPNANEIQLKVLELLMNTGLIHDINLSSRYDAQQFAELDGTVESLPDDQWIKELKTWESIAWAGHQIVLADYAIGPTIRDPLSKSYVLPPSSEAEKRLCGMQKMRKPGGFVNINLFGLVFTIVVSSTIVLIDLVLVRSLVHLQRYVTRIAPRLERWFQDGIYQLQRRAHEAQGNGVWERLTEEVPITSDKCDLPDLHIELFPSLETPMSKTQSVQDRSGSQIHESWPHGPEERTHIDLDTPKLSSVTTETELYHEEDTSFEILLSDYPTDRTSPQPDDQRLSDACL